MSQLKPDAQAAIAANENWEAALQAVLSQIGPGAVDVVFLFASSAYAEHYPELLRGVLHATGASLLLGCSGQGIVGGGQELEDVPSLSLLTLSLPGTSFRAIRLTQELLDQELRPLDWQRKLALSPEDVNAWLLFADPFQMDCEGLIESLSTAYPGLPMVGGLASSDFVERRTFIFWNEEVFTDGGIALALGGDYTIMPLISQGCDPIGETWTITKVQDDGLIETISNRPALHMLTETFQGLRPDIQHRAQRNLLIGLAADEYLDTFERGSFLIRTLLGVDRRTGSIAIGAFPRVGQTIQFQMRDADTADLDLKELLKQARITLVNNRPVAALLCTCNGRGENMFAEPNHDASLVEHYLGPLPMSGLFCNGEIGPIGQKPHLHGFTASLALFVKKE
ncbi:MAG TPA: FIST N-terminal domain-containing protein [Ktedonobacteraceae bacterium]